MNTNEMLKECRKLAKAQNYIVRRSKRINKINGKACYELMDKDSGLVEYQGGLVSVWETLLTNE